MLPGTKIFFFFFLNVLKIWIRSLKRMILRTLTEKEGCVEPWSSRGRFSWKTVMTMEPSTLSQTSQLVGYVLTQAPPYGESVQKFPETPAIRRTLLSIGCTNLRNTGQLNSAVPLVEKLYPEVNFKLCLEKWVAFRREMALLTDGKA